MRKNACTLNPRNIAIVEAFKSGVMTPQLAEQHGLSISNICNVIRKFGVGSASGGQSIRSTERMNRLMVEKIQNRRIRSEKTASLFGCTADELFVLNGGLGPWDKSARSFVFNEQKRSAKRRGIEFLLTYPEWCDIWDKSDKYHLRGRGHGYVMSRYGDSGPYATWNVYICNAIENNSDGGKKSAITRRSNGPSHLIGSGRGWSIYRGKYVVQFRGKHMGQFTSQDDAEARYKQVVADYFAELKAPKRQAEVI